MPLMGQCLTTWRKNKDKQRNTSQCFGCMQRKDRGYFYVNLAGNVERDGKLK